MGSAYLVAALLDKVLPFSSIIRALISSISSCKLSNVDSDIRFMALSDLNAELQRDSFIFDESTEKKIVAAVIKSLDDKNGEVQQQAVKILAPLVKRVREQQLLDILEQLCNLLAQKKDELRDISAIGLKSVIGEVNASSPVARNMIHRLVPRLLTLLKDLSDVQLDIIDILGEILSRFGQVLNFGPEPSNSQGKQIQDVLLVLLDHTRPAVRKRATAALGSLVINSSDELFTELIAQLHSDMLAKAKARSYDRLRTLIGAVSTISPQRLGKSLDILLPLIAGYVAIDDDELRENCLQAFESLVLRCPTEISPSISILKNTGLQYLTYDPNYEEVVDDDIDMDMDGEPSVDMDAMDAEDSANDSEEEEEDYSDADDMSWKVRRGSAKLLASIIGTRSELLTSLFPEVAPVLISRFKEREESVRIEIMTTFISFIRQVANATSGRLKDQWKKSASTLVDPRTLLLNEVPRLCKSLAKQFNGKSEATRQTGYILLRELVLVLDGGLNNRLSLFVPSIGSSLSHIGADRSSNNPNLKIDALQFLRALFATHDLSAIEIHLGRLVPPIVAAAKDKFYKISSEALLVIAELVRVMEPLCHNTGQLPQSGIDAKGFVMLLYTTVLERLKISDVDLEVKERSIVALGSLISQAGEIIGASEIQTIVIPILIERFRNELTRLTTLRVLRSFCESDLFSRSFASINIIPASIALEIASFLRKSSRQLRVAALSCLQVLVKQFGASWPCDSLHEIIAELQLLLVELDLNIFALALSVIVVVLNVDGTGSCVKSARSTISTTLVRIIVDSPHLVAAGSGLAALLSFWRCIADKGGMPAFDETIEIVMEPVARSSLNVPRQSFRPLAQSAAALTLKLSNDLSRKAFIKRFISTIEDSGSSDNQRLLSLLIIGEIGRANDLFALSPNLHLLLLDLFSHQSDEIKQAAAFCLGNVALGNLPEYLPPIFEALKTSGKRRYLVFVSLKEIISCSGPGTVSPGTELLPYISDLWKLLFYNTEEELEEGTRAIIEECLGKLALSRPQELLLELRASLKSDSPNIRATVVAAIRYTITDSESEEFDTLLGQLMVEFLRLIKDDDLNVRRVSLLTFNSVAHNKPYLIQQSLNELLPLLYNETKINKKYVREVMMGPFKEVVDDGLDARKSAFECLFTLLETSLSHIDLFVFLDRVIEGLSDTCQEIKTLCHLMLQRVAVLTPTALLSRLDLLISPLKETITSKPKNNAVKQEIEKYNDLVRSAVRTALVLGRIFAAQHTGIVARGTSLPGFDVNITGKFDDFLKDCRAATNPAADTFLSVQAEMEAQMAMGVSRATPGALGPMDLS